MWLAVFRIRTVKISSKEMTKKTEQQNIGFNRDSRHEDSKLLQGLVHLFNHWHFLKLLSHKVNETCIRITKMCLPQNCCGNSLVTHKLWFNK